jgi:hypothetical protein
MQRVPKRLKDRGFSKEHRRHGILVLHKGRVVYERYFGALSAEKQHLVFSVRNQRLAAIHALA